MIARRTPATNAPNEDRVKVTKEVLRTLRKSRSALDNLQQHHAAAYVDIAVQLVKQTIAEEEAAGIEDD